MYKEGSIPLAAIPLLSMCAFIALPLLWLGPQRALQLTLPVCAAWLVILYASIRLGILGLEGSKSLLTMTFLIFAYTFLGFVPLVQLTAASNSLVNRYSESLLVRAFGVVLSGMAAFDIGRSYLRLAPFSFIARRVFQERRVDAKRTLALGGISLIGLPLLISAFGGWQQLFLARADRLQVVWSSTNSPDSQAALQIVYALMTTPIFIAFFAALALYRSRYSLDAIGAKRVGLGIVVLLGIVTLVINNPVSTARFWVGTILLSVSFYLLRWRRRITISIASLAITLLFLLVFPFADMFRYSLDVELGGVFSEKLETQLVDKGDYDSYEQIVNSIAYVDRNGVSAGRQLLGTALFWVPRSIWSGKPIPSGPLVAEFRGAENLNVSLPLWGEFFLDGDILLVVVGFLLYGSFVGVIENRFDSAPETGLPTFAGLFVRIYAAYQFFLLRGPLLATAAYLTPVIFCIWFCTRRVREGLPAGSKTLQWPVSREVPRQIV